MIKTVEQNHANEIVRFNKKPRSNLAIEILRFVALLLLLFNHAGYIGLYHFNNVFINHLQSTAGHSINVFAFTAITGIFTTGKGKDYFMRNLSRLLFVLVVFITIMIPIYYTTNTSITPWYKYSLNTVLFGGRDTWYLWQIAVISIFLPLVKIQKWISINPIINILLVIAFVAPWCTELFSTGYLTSGIKLFCVSVGAYILFHTYSFFRQQPNAKVWVYHAFFWTSALLIFGASITIVNTIDKQWLLVPGMIFVTVALTSLNFSTPKWFAWIVRNTYYIYELHFLMQLMFSYILMYQYHQFDGTHVYVATAGQLWGGYFFVLGASLFGSILLSNLQYKLWEKFVAEKFIYKHKQWSKGYWVIVAIFVFLYVFYCVIGMANITLG